MINWDEIFYKFLAASYLYYQLDEETPWRDSEYDMWARDLLKNWEAVTHEFKDLVTEDDLRAGTLYAVTSYPYEVIEYAREWQAKCMA